MEIFLDREAPPEHLEWFERAVSCCAYLAWSLAAKSTGIRFRSQEYDLRLPEEGDIYTILKYLALVYPLLGRGPEPPLDDTGYQIVFTRTPEKFAAAGWTGGHLVGPDDLGPGSGAAGTR